MSVAWGSLTMSSTTPSELHPLAVIRVLPAPTPRAAVSPQVAAGTVGATVLCCAAAIEVARAWTTAPHVFAEAGHVLGGVMVALFVLAGVGVATRSRPLGGLAVASSFALLAHGLTLVLQGQTIGAVFIGLAPIAALLAHVAFLPTPIAPVPPSSARIDIAWAIAKSRQKTARAARPAVSPSPIAMHA
jgi:hypothetical protein